MRVTDKMIFEGSLAGVSVARKRANKAFSDVSTGYRVRHPKDDPAAAGLIVRAGSNDRDLTPFAKWWSGHRTSWPRRKMPSHRSLMS